MLLPPTHNLWVRPFLQNPLHLTPSSRLLFPVRHKMDQLSLAIADVLTVGRFLAPPNLRSLGAHFWDWLGRQHAGLVTGTIRGVWRA